MCQGFQTAQTAQTVPTDATTVSDRLGQVVGDLRSPSAGGAVELDPDLYQVIRNASVDESSPEVQAFAGKVDDLAKGDRSADELAASRAALTPLFIHSGANGASGSESSGGPSTTTSPTTTTKIGSAHRSASASASASRQASAAGCQKAKDEVTWDLIKLGGALAAAIGGGLTIETGAGLVVLLGAYAAFAGALHDLRRDSAAANDPDGPCGPGDNRGDPHIRTFDHLRYAPQAVGEFVLTTAVGRAADGETIQVRQQPFGTSRGISIVTGVAADVAGDRVSIVSTDAGAAVKVGGVDTAIDGNGTTLPKGGRVIAVEPNDLRIVWPSGTILRALIQTRRMAVSVRLTTSLAGTTSGLLGNADGNPDNDLTTRTGTLITSETDRAQLYGQFMDSWRITDAESLFTYDSGQSTATFTDTTFPDALRTVADLTAEQRAMAERVCAAAGITEPAELDECLFDVGFSGDESFAYALADSLGLINGDSSSQDLGDGRTTGRISNPGDSVEYRFTAAAGEVRYFRADPACKDSKLSWRVLDASGKAISNYPYLCNDVGRIAFTAAGTYRLVVESYNGSTGDYAFTWETSTSSSGGLETGRTTGRITSAGQVDTYAFDATAGEVRFFAHDDACADSKLAWRLLDATDKQITGYPYLCNDLGRFQFTATGVYRLVVESYNGSTGDYAFAWNSVTDQGSTLSNGRTAGTIAAKGQVNTYSFDAQAGDTRTFTADSGCSDSQLAWRVLDSTGRQITSYPYICNDVGAVPISVTGTYRLVVESYNGSTGSYAFTAS